MSGRAITPGRTAGGLEVLDETRGDRVFAQRLRAPDDLPCLVGHFPGLPVLPGLAQLQWAVAGAEVLRGEPVQVRRLEALKFRELLRPGEPFTAKVSAQDDPDRIDLEVLREDRVVASARIRLGSAPADLGYADPVQPTGDAVAANELIPHAGPMVFLDRLVAGDEKRTVCSVRVDALRLFRAEGGALPGWAGIEPMAQCIAAHGGLEARRVGEEPRIGFLLGCRRLAVADDWLLPGVAYVASAEQVWGGEQGLVSFDCALFERDGGRRLLTGRINAYLPADLNDVLEGRLGG